MRQTLILFGIIAGFVLFFYLRYENLADEFVEYFNDTSADSYNDEIDMDKLFQLEEAGKNEEIIEYIEEEMLPLAQKNIRDLEARKDNYKSGEIKKHIKLEIEAVEFWSVSLEEVALYYEGEVTEAEIEKRNEETNEKFQTALDYYNKYKERYELVWSGEYDKDGNRLAKRRDLK